MKIERINEIFFFENKVELEFENKVTVLLRDHSKVEVLKVLERYWWNGRINLPLDNIILMGL